MKACCLLLNVAFLCPVFAEDPRQPEGTADIANILQEISTVAPSVGRQDLADALRRRTYGKRVLVTDATVTRLDETNTYPLDKARSFAGLYVLHGASYPEPSSLGPKDIIQVLRTLMGRVNCQGDLEAISCSGVGLLIVNQRKNSGTYTYTLLASNFHLRQLRLGQLVCLEATASGLSLEQGRLEVFGVLKRIQTR